MSIITISRGTSSRGREIAEKLSRKLGYKCISRASVKCGEWNSCFEEAIMGQTMGRCNSS